jgi:phosphomannomutase
MNQSIFKAYDIRGIYPTDLNETDSYNIGLAFANFISSENQGKKVKILVSRDMRLSSPALTERVIAGLVDGGVDVLNIGLASTPTFYLAVSYFQTTAGIHVSASHNPKDYNGFKMVRANGVPVSGENGIQTIKELILNNKLQLASEKGMVENRENQTAMLLMEFKKEFDWQGIKPFTIVVDGANAMSILDIPEIFKDVPIKLITINFELDGSFPNHEADPFKEENLVQIKKAVLENHADLGISPDGDGDRIFFIDEQGTTIRQEVLRGIMAQVALKEYPGASICYDIRPGKITRDMIVEAGGIPSVTKVGHSLIKEQMIALNSVFGGESSGHYFYKTKYGVFEAPTMMILKFLKWLSENNQPVSQAIKPYLKYFSSGEINSKVADTKEKINELAKKYKDAKISYLDGITVEYNDYWFNVRPSNTEPLLRLNLEATTVELMKTKTQEVLDFIRS